tara:strand:- start:197 stop:418 length:222 start_codon:yes stop_codon:yes gene_type:complete
MKQTIMDVLEYFKDANLHSESARVGIAEEVAKRLREKISNDNNYVYSGDVIEKLSQPKYEPYVDDEYDGGHLG